MNTITPILLLTGYLGSGKTTLVNHILTNKKGIKFAVIVNDIGEVNIDASLIQQGGVVNKKDESLVALQNGCICCTLKMDLVEQLDEIARMQRFDYIVIEASGICEPEPIARTIMNIPRMAPQYAQHGMFRLDCIATVVDALRLQSEFSNGEDLTRKHIDDEDIENLLIQQIEFCNMIILNKVSEVSPQELGRIKQIIRALQPTAPIFETDYANIDIDNIINTYLFDFEDVVDSAGWIHEFEKEVDEDMEEEAHHPHHHDEEEHHEHHHHDDDDDADDDEEHEHHHHHHHHHHDHEGGEVEEYGISTFVYYRRQPFDLMSFDNFIAKKWNKNIIRAKGLCYFNNEPDISYLFEQSGVQKKITDIGYWFCTASKEDLKEILDNNPDALRDWDDYYGDRMIKIVFIGQHMDIQQLTKELDACLTDLKL